jgi:hypothetical protein
MTFRYNNLQAHPVHNCGSPECRDDLEWRQRGPAAAVLCCIGFVIGFLVGAEAKQRPIGRPRPVSPASAIKSESVASKQTAA